MKIRNGFVSNSSSSSFVIEKHWLSPYQLDLIRNHITKGKRVLWEDHGYILHDEDAWRIHETDTTIEGSTIMDNFDMYHYLNEIVEVDSDHVKSTDWMAPWDDWGDE